MSAWTRLRGYRVDLLLVVAAVVMVAVVVWDRGRVTTAEAEKRHHAVLDARRVDDVDAITLAAPGQPVVALKAQRDDRGVRTWSLLVDGKAVSADDAAVSQLLVTLDDAGFLRPAGAGGDYGLSPPAGTITVSMPPLSYRIELGGPAPSPEGARYLRVDGGARGEQTYVVEGRLAEALSPDPTRYRRRSLSPYDPDDLKAIRLTTSDALHGGFTLARGDWGGRAAGAFTVDGTPRRRADRRTLDGWFRTLERLEAARFSAEPVKQARASLALTPREGPVATLHIGGTCSPPPGGTPAEGATSAGEGTVKVTREGVEPATACVAADLVARLFLDAATLRDPHVVGTAETDIVELELKGTAPGGQEAVVDLARKDTGWHMRRPDDTRPDQRGIADLLRGLVEATGREVTPDGEEGLKELGLAPSPQARVVIRGLPSEAGGDDARVEEIWVGTTEENAINVQRRDDGAVLRLGVEQGRAFLPRPGALRSLQLFDVDVAEVKGLTLDCGKKQALSRGSSGAWTLEAPSDLGVRADMGQATAYVDRFRQAKAIRWVAETDDDGQGLDEPWCKITLARSEGDDLHLRLGAETGEGYYAHRRPDGPVFVVNRGLGRLAEQWMLARSSLLIDTAGVARARLVERGGGTRTPAAEQTVEITVKDDGSWASEPAGLGEVLRETLDDLLAEGAVTVGPAAEGEGMGDPQLVIEVWRAHADTPTVLRIGRGDVWRDTSVFFVRRDGIDVTFAVAQSRLRALLDRM